MGPVVGIVAEYNPFHEGHTYHLNEAVRLINGENTEETTVVAVMSGDFVQRGEPAIASKGVRAETAVNQGVDLVIELPFVYAGGNAEYFAKGAVKILSGLGVVTHMAWGSESGDESLLMAAADVFASDSSELNLLIKDGMSAGKAYPRAREEALKVLTGSGKIASLLRSPNDTLGIEYLKQLKLQGVGDTPQGRRNVPDCWEKTSIDIKPIIVKRVSGVTASEIRAEMRGGVDALEPLLQFLSYICLTNTNSELSEIISATEGLENRLISAVRKSSSMADVIKRTKTKRYVETRIRRLILHTVIGLTKEDMRIADSGEIYGRILGASEKGTKLIRRIKKEETAKFPLISNPKKQIGLLTEPSQIMIRKYDLLASDLYQLIMSGSLDSYSDDLISPWIAGHTLKGTRARNDAS
jgi:predicted nucleotidyltransferase